MNVVVRLVVWMLEVWIGSVSLLLMLGSTLFLLSTYSASFLNAFGSQFNFVFEAIFAEYQPHHVVVYCVKGY